MSIRTFDDETESPDEKEARLARETVIWKTMPAAARQYLQVGRFDPLGFAVCFSYWWDFETDTWKAPTALPTKNIELQGGGVGVATSIYERFVEKTG